MKAVMISIQPQWCKKIANGLKTIEVRKTIPKLQTPFKCYIYCTNAKPYLAWADVFRGNWETEIDTIHGYSRKAAEKIWDIFNGSVMGEFVCDYIFTIDVDFNIHDELPGSPVETWLTWDDAPEQYVDGTEIRVGYPKEGMAVWWIEIEKLGTAAHSFQCCKDEDARIYSDIFEIDAEVKSHSVIKQKYNRD